MSRPMLPLLLVFALGLGLGWWLGRRDDGATPPAVGEIPVERRPEATSPAPAFGPSGAAGLPPLTASERQALQASEIERSAAAEAPRTYRGIDGKPKAFNYPDPVAAESAERTRQARRDELMRELEADPVRFSREHRLSLKQVQWIADGDADFPDELLDP